MQMQPIHIIFVLWCTNKIYTYQTENINKYATWSLSIELCLPQLGVFIIQKEFKLHKGYSGISEQIKPLQLVGHTADFRV